MEFREIIERARQVKEKYAQLEKKNYGRAWSRGEVMMGFVGDVGALMKLVMAKEGLRRGEEVDQKLAHELADCLWSVLVLADKYRIDLERAFLDAMEELEEHLEDHP